MPAHPRNTTDYPTWTPAQDADLLPPLPGPPGALLGDSPSTQPAGLPPGPRISAHRGGSRPGPAKDAPRTAPQRAVSWPTQRTSPETTTRPASSPADTSTWPLDLLNSRTSAPVAAAAPVKGRPWLHLVAYPVVLAAGIAIGMVPRSDPAPAATSPQTSPVTRAAASAPVSTNGNAGVSMNATTDPAAPRTSFSDGTYLVGEDIAPGHYVTTAAGGTLGCYWARLRNTDGDLDSILANDNIRGRTTVTIRKSDGAFETSGGCLWTRR